MASIIDTRFDIRTAALVLKVGRYRLHHGGLAIIRTLGRVGIPVYAVHEDFLVPPAHSAYLYGGFIWKTSDEADYQRQLLAGIIDIATQIGRPCVVIPTDDHAAVFLSDRAAELPEQFITPSCPSGLVRSLTNKASCLDIAKRFGLATPWAMVQRCPAPDSVLQEVPLPMVVKRAERGLLPDGTRTYSTVIAENFDQLRSVLTGLAEPHDVILQEVIPGKLGDDWLFIAYCNADSVSLISCTGRKLRSHPAYAGEIAYARSEDNPKLREQVEQFLKDIGYVGIVSIDLRYDRRDDTYKVLDVNPRPGAGFRLFENIHGVDVVRALHLDLTGREVPQGPQRDGRTYLVENYDAWTQRSYRIGGDLTLRSWLRAFCSADEHAWLIRDDLMPAGLLGLQTLVGSPQGRYDRSAGPTRPRYFRGRGHPR
jgi:predicted ATP-grasp superfamily ATP-dependent carboligase